MTAPEIVHPADVARSSVDAVNRGDAPGYAAHYTDGATIHDPFYAEPLTGRDAIEHDIAVFLRAFPDLHGRVRSTVTEGSQVATEVTFTGTHHGPLETPDGDVPATGRPVTLALCGCSDVGPDGLMTATRRYYDVAGLLAQLGQS
jgi:steroid delta-isomerase-like uncharacterized protein